MMRYFLYLFISGFLWACQSPPSSPPPPNIILILADDMGFSDLGCFGAEIRTPHLDRLATGGLRMTQFYNAARCCPSRASLLMGRHPHRAGVGSMTDYTLPDHPAYQGFLRQDAPTLAEALKAAGYQTYHSGKWHVGNGPGQLPLDRGFDHSFCLAKGAASYFDFLPYRNDEWPFSDPEITVYHDRERVAPPDTLFYLTDVFTDYAVDYVAEAAQTDSPFFLYLAYTAPHWPLHALPEDIARYEGQYLGGWDSLRQLRYDRQLALGLLDSGQAPLSPRFERVPPWDSVPDSMRRVYDRRMAVYAAMIDRMDQQIGRLLAQLEETGAAENTLVVFLSDNGASRAEGTGYLHPRFDRSAPVGSPQSFEGYGQHWANVSDAPFRRFKSEVHEGGIATPFIAYWPEQLPAGRIESGSYGHIADLLPTLVAAAGATPPAGLDGIDLLPLWAEGAAPKPRPLVWEHYGNRAIRDDKWKLVALQGQDWELYDLSQDRAELRDLSAALPDTVARLQAAYQAWTDSLDILPVDELHRRYREQ